MADLAVKTPQPSASRTTADVQRKVGATEVTGPLWSSLLAVPPLFRPHNSKFSCFSGPKQKTTPKKKRFTAEQAAGLLCSFPGQPPEEDPEQALVDKYEELMEKGRSHLQQVEENAVPPAEAEEG